jgi:hypothetical protein
MTNNEKYYIYIMDAENVKKENQQIKIRLYLAVRMNLFTYKNRSLGHSEKSPKREMCDLMLVNIDLHRQPYSNLMTLVKLLMTFLCDFYFWKQQEVINLDLKKTLYWEIIILW